MFSLINCNHLLLWAELSLTMFNGIDPTIGDFDDLVESDKRCLKWGQVDQKIHCLCIGLFQLVNLLTTAW